MTAVEQVQISSEDGRRWIEQSLQAGFDLSDAAREILKSERGGFWTYVPGEREDGDFVFPYRGDVPRAVAVAGLTDSLEQLIDRGAKSIVIEDDLSAAGDAVLRKMTVPSAYLDGRVIHWLGLAEGPTMNVVELINESASHTLNAFVLRCSIRDLSLEDDERVRSELPGEVAESLMAIVTLAFDETSFALWEREVPGA